MMQDMSFIIFPEMLPVSCRHPAMTAAGNIDTIALKAIKPPNEE
jgi:hypothetical protein